MADGVIGAPLSGLILTHLDGALGFKAWHWLFLAGGLPCIPLAWLVLKRLDDKVDDATWLTSAERAALTARLAADTRHVAGHSLREALKIPAFLLLGVVYFLVQIASYGMNFWLPQLIKSSNVSDPQIIGLLTAIPYLCGGIAMLIVGRVADRIGDRRLIFMTCILIVGVGFAGAAYFAHDTVPLVASLAFIGIGLLTAIPAFWSLPPKVVTGAGAAAGIALINSLGQMGGVVSPTMVGLVKDVTGSTTPALYAISAVCVACALIAAFGFPEVLRARDR